MFKPGPRASLGRGPAAWNRTQNLDYPAVPINVSSPILARPLTQIILLDS
jgi:hypothetical protein